MRISRTGLRKLRPHAERSALPQAGSWPVVADMTSRPESARESGTINRAAKLFLLRVQLIECALQLFQFLAGFTKLAFGRQSLVVGKVFGGFRDERAAILCRLGRRGGCRSASGRLSSGCRGAQRRSSAAKKSRHCALEPRCVG